MGRGSLPGPGGIPVRYDRSGRLLSSTVVDLDLIKVLIQLFVDDEGQYLSNALEMAVKPRLSEKMRAGFHTFYSGGATVGLSAVLGLSSGFPMMTSSLKWVFMRTSRVSSGVSVSLPLGSRTAPSLEVLLFLVTADIFFELD